MFRYNYVYMDLYCVLCHGIQKVETYFVVKGSSRYKCERDRKMVALTMVDYQW